MRLRSNTSWGFSLLEIIAVLAILAILVAVLAPSFVKSIDQAVYNKESADLQSYADALQRSIQRNRIIPGQTTWASTVAAEVGISISSVQTNIRNFPRRFVIDPAFEVGANGSSLAYTQSMTGSVVTDGSGFIVRPKSPRVMFISSIGRQDVPVVTGESAADFNDIWNTPNYSNPAWLVSHGWAGNGEDLVIQRVNLSGLFVHLLLFNYPSTPSTVNYGAYAIDRQGTNYVPNSMGTNMYVIKNTMLGLLETNSTDFILDSEQIINQDSIFVYDSRVWRNSIFDVPEDAGTTSTGITDKFLASRWNTNSFYSQIDVVSNIMAFMNAYINYKATDFTTGESIATNAQAVMMLSIRSLINNPVQGACQ
jgi:prepilin-type N-terminal cleavage/methylation domain-containing protein